MDEYTLLLISTISIAVLLILLTAVSFLWWRSEKKLAKHGESIIYKQKKGRS